MEGKSLEQVLTAGGDVAEALNRYFPTAPRPSTSVVTADALNVLLNGVRQSSEFVPVVVKCLDDFVSNQEMSHKWLLFDEELSKLCAACLDNVKSFPALFRNICGIISNFSEIGEPLSSALFNICAGKFLNIVNNCSVETEVQALSALNNICRFSELNNICETFLLQSAQIDKLAARCLTFSVDAQISVYMILMKGLHSREDALSKASLWFPKWPKIQSAFVDFFPGNIAEGCGAFLNAIHDLSEKGGKPLASMGKLISSTPILKDDPHIDLSIITPMSTETFGGISNIDASGSLFKALKLNRSKIQPYTNRKGMGLFHPRPKALKWDRPQLKPSSSRTVQSIDSDDSDDFFSTPKQEGRGSSQPLSKASKLNRSQLKPPSSSTVQSIDSDDSDVFFSTPKQKSRGSSQPLSKASKLNRSQLKPSSSRTVQSIDSDDSDDFFATPPKRQQSNGSSAPPRFTFQKAPSSPLHRLPLEAGKLNKRIVYLKGGEWCLHSGKYVPPPGRWSSFKEEC